MTAKPWTLSILSNRFSVLLYSLVFCQLYARVDAFIASSKISWHTQNLPSQQQQQYPKQRSTLSLLHFRGNTLTSRKKKTPGVERSDKLHHHKKILGSITLSRRNLLFISSSTATSFLFSNAGEAAMSSNTSESFNGGEVCWGIVGLGDVCTVKAGPAFVKCHNSRLVAAMRRTPGAAQQWIQDHNDFVPSDCRAYDDLEQFLKDPEMTAVYIATPPESHYQVACQVAKAGKIAYIEKPVGRCAAETQAIIDCFQKSSSSSLYTAYISRAYDRTRAIIDLLNDGVIGNQVTSISYQLNGSNLVRGLDNTSSSPSLPWRVDAQNSGGGLIMDVGCHVLDRLDYIFGPLIKVTGKASQSTNMNQLVEDYVKMQAEIGTSSNGSSSLQSPSHPTTIAPTAVANIESTGAKVDCIWNFSPDVPPLDELTVTGNNGLALQMAGMSPSLPIHVIDSTTGKIVKEISCSEESSTQNTKSLSFDVPKHTAQPLVQTIVNEILQKEQKTKQGYEREDVSVSVALSRGDNAFRTSKVLDTILSSYYGGREIGYWDRSNTWPGRLNSSSP